MLEPLRSLEIARRQAVATREILERFVPGIPAPTIRATCFAFEGLAANVVKHSDAAETGFGLVAADPDLRRIQIAFGDAGVGFRESLQTGRLGLEPSLKGLAFLATLADRLDGDLWIASGDALLVRRTDSEHRRNERIESTEGWNGAWLCLDAPVPGW